MKDDEINYFKTIEECKKAIIDKSINVDITFSVGENLLNALFRIIRTIFVWIFIFSIAYTILTFNSGFIGIRFILYEGLVYTICALLTSWVKFNYNNYYESCKKTLIKNMICKCEELQSYDVDSIEFKESVDEMFSLGGIGNVIINNNKH